MDYKPFYFIIAKYKNGKITRERFIFDWELAQREQETVKENKAYFRLNYPETRTASSLPN